MQDQISSRTGWASLCARSRVGAGGLLALALLGLAGCGSAPKTAFDLSAPRGRGGSGGGQVVVPEPSALQAYESERIAVRSAGGTVSVLPDGQWADRLPRLLQGRLIQTFENVGRARASRPGDGVTPDGQLNLDIRAFQFEAGTGEVVVEIFCRLLDARTGRVTRSRLFAGRAPVGQGGAGAVAPTLDAVTSRILVDITRWVGGGPAPIAPPDAALRTRAL